MYLHLHSRAGTEFQHITDCVRVLYRAITTRSEITQAVITKLLHITVNLENIFVVDGSYEN